jgi:uncharacterized membrane protein required for colicin V production
MTYFLDLSLVAIILITVITCWRRGFIRSVFGALKAVIAAILTYMFAPKVSSTLLDRVFSDRVYSFVYRKLVSLGEEGTQTFDLAAILQKIPDSIRILLNNFHVDLNAIVDKYGAIGDAGEEELMEVASSISTPVAGFLSNALGYTITFVVASALLALLALILSQIADLPVIKKCDRFLGLLLGVLGAIFYSSLYILIAYALLSWLEAAYGNIPFSESFEQTYIFRPMYDFNIFRLIFGL